MIDRKIKCDNCGNMFEMTDIQLSRYIKNPNKHIFCSKSCSAKYSSAHRKKNITNNSRNELGQFQKREYEITEGVCTQCGKTFKLSATQLKRVNTDPNLNIFCSKSCSAKYSNAHRDNKTWQAQAKKTKLAKYDDENYNNKEEISKSVKKLYETRDDYGFNSEHYKQVMLDKYGVDNIGKSKWMKEHNLETFGTEFYFQSDDYKNQMESLYNSPDDYYGRVSKVNSMIIEYIKSLGVNCYVEKYIKPYYYDIVVNDVLIEVDPTITHNTQFSIFSKEPIDKMYHLNKCNTAKEAGYRCIHIFDWDDWQGVVKTLITHNTVYARKCIIKSISIAEANSFINQYHLQGVCKGNEYNYGLYYNGKLVQVMTFGKPRYNKKYEFELLRLCTRYDYRVVGGAEKLFKYFINAVSPTSVISYCDLSKFSGDVYGRLGFELQSVSSPAIHWYNMKTKRHITDNLLRQRGYSQLHNDKDYNKYAKGQSNEEIMLAEGYVTVYDCGQATYVYNRDDK